MAAQITIVGGGSTHWSPSLLVDFANDEALGDAGIVLMDLDESALAATVEAGRHVAACRGIPLSVRGTTDLDAALDGADFVVTALSVGGFESMRHDLEIPARYGIRQPIGDSVGPGGIFRALRSTPVLLGVARAMERRCPSALLVNVTNPLSTLCSAVAKETSVEVVGLCNEIVGFQFVMSLLFDAAMHLVDPVVGGVNHLPVATSLKIDGDDGFAMLRDALDGGVDLSEPLWMDPPHQMYWRQRDPQAGWTKGDVLENVKIKVELFNRFGVLPLSADSHVAEFFPGFVAQASDYGRTWGVRHYGMAGHRAAKDLDNAGLAALMGAQEISPIPSGELVAPLLGALVADRSAALPVNIPNTGQVRNLPEGAVVECIGIADGSGLRPRDSVAVPSYVGEHLRRVVSSQELTVSAALSGDRSIVVEAMLADPTAGAMAYEQLVAMTDEMLAATASWLPNFAS